jgi:undecaprenyl-diphosphatase
MAAVAAAGLLVVKSASVTALDLKIDSVLSDYNTGTVSTIANVIYKVFSPIYAIAVTVVIVIIIWFFSRNWRSAVTFGALVGGSWVSSAVIKYLVNRDRPDVTALANPFLPTPTDASYPSGHVVFAVSLAIAFMFLARSSARFAITVILGVVGALAVAVAVLVLGVHYPTDSIASAVWALGASLVILAIWNRFIVPATHRKPKPHAE